MDDSEENEDYVEATPSYEYQEGDPPISPEDEPLEGSPGSSGIEENS